MEHITLTAVCLFIFVMRSVSLTRLLSDLSDCSVVTKWSLLCIMCDKL